MYTTSPSHARSALSKGCEHRDNAPIRRRCCSAASSACFRPIAIISDATPTGPRGRGWFPLKQTSSPSPGSSSSSSSRRRRADDEAPSLNRGGRFPSSSDGVIVRSSGGTSSSLDNLRSSYPFITDPSMITEDVTYTGPLFELRGCKAYVEAMESWEANLPERLEEFQVKNSSVFMLEPGSMQGKCTFSFVAALPPGSRDRGLPEDLEVLPGDRARVSTSVRSDITLDAEGRIVSQTDRITDGYDVPATISRYEFLTAQNLYEPGPVWYWKVLRATTMEEQDVYAGGQMSENELENTFVNMVARNFAAGLLLGAVIYGGLKAVQIYSSYSGSSPL